MAPSVEVNVLVTVRSYIFVSLMLLGGVRLEDDAGKATTCATLQLKVLISLFCVYFYCGFFNATSTAFQFQVPVYHGGQFYWWRKLDYLKKSWINCK
jgi:hypothetical protein